MQKLWPLPQFTLTAQHVVRHVCTTKSQTTLLKSVDQKSEDNDFTLYDKPKPKPNRQVPIQHYQQHLSRLFSNQSPYLVSPTESNRYRDEVLVSINLNLPQDTHKNTILKTKLDTGAQGNILPTRLYRQMYPHNLNHHGSLRPGSLSPSDVILTAYGGSQIKHHGTVTIPCSYRGENARASFYVTDTPGPAIIGLPTSTDLKLLPLNFSIEENDPTPRKCTVSREQPLN